jgi:hypothetical protein
MNQPVEALFNAEDFPSESDRCFDGGADDRIQSGAVSTASKDANSHRRNIFLEAEAFLKIFDYAYRR